MSNTDMLLGYLLLALFLAILFASAWVTSVLAKYMGLSTFWTAFDAIMLYQFTKLAVETWLARGAE